MACWLLYSKTARMPGTSHRHPLRASEFNERAASMGGQNEKDTRIRENKKDTQD